MKSETIIPPPLTLQEGGGDQQPAWVSIFKFQGAVSEKAKTLTYAAIDPLLRHAFVILDDDNEAMTLRLRGYLDQVVQDSADVMKPLVGSIITNQLVSVQLISPEDAITQVQEFRRIKCYDVTSTIFDLMGIKKRADNPPKP